MIDDGFSYLTKDWCTKKWNVEQRKFIEIDQDVAEGVVPEDHVNVDHVFKRYCFCREIDDGDSFLECDSETCKIKWYHPKCLNVTENDIPENWTCPLFLLLFFVGV